MGWRRPQAPYRTGNWSKFISERSHAECLIADSLEQIEGCKFPVKWKDVVIVGQGAFGGCPAPEGPYQVAIILHDRIRLEHLDETGVAINTSTDDFIAASFSGHLEPGEAVYSN